MANQTEYMGTKLNTGDLVKVSQVVKEEKKDRMLIFEGRVISIRGRGVNKTFTIRKIGIDGIGVEKIFPLNSPTISKIEIKKKIPVKRAKLYTLRKV